MKARRRCPGRLILAVIIALVVAACGSGAAPPQEYALEASVAAPARAVSQADLPVIEIRPVRLPEYLDSTNLVTRRPGGQIMPSPTARWGERLSVGADRFMVMSLASQLPNAAVTAMPLEQSAWQVSIDLDAFEPRPDGTCVLAGRWALRNARRGVTQSERVALSVPIGGDNDEQVVAAMTRVLGELSERIAAAIRSELSR